MLLKNAIKKWKVIHLEPSNICQLNCFYCYKKNFINNSELPLSKWLHIINKTYNTTQQFTIGGGEPLLYKNLDRLITHINSKRVPLSITTNGLLLENYQYLLSKINLISISYHGDIKRIEQGLKLLTKLNIQRCVNLIAVDKNKKILNTIIDICKWYSSSLLLLYPKQICGEVDKTYFLSGVVKNRDKIQVGLDGLFLGQCRAGKDFYTITSHGKRIQCSFINNSLNNIQEFKCLDTNKTGITIPLTG